jgi:hypothetical protein
MMECGTTLERRRVNDQFEIADRLARRIGFRIRLRMVCAYIDCPTSD